MAIWGKNTPDGTASAKVTVYRGLVLLKSIKGPEGQWKQGGEYKAPHRAFQATDRIWAFERNEKPVRILSRG